MVSKIGLYAYGLVGKSPKQLNIIGIDKKSKVYPVEGDGICVMVSKIDTNKFQDEIKKLLSKLSKTTAVIPGETEEILKSHEDVVETLMKLTSIVPFKFGTILKNEKAALKMLRDYGKKFKKLLSKFSGKEEWGIKVYADSKKLKDYIAENEPKLKKETEQKRKLSAGAAYLFGRKMEEEIKDKVTARLSEIAKVIFQEAGKCAYETKINKTLPKKLTGKDKEMVLNSAYLIEKETVSQFDSQVKSLIKKYEPMGLEIEFSGPWPPYNFT